MGWNDEAKFEAFLASYSGQGTKITKRVTKPIGATGTTSETTADWCFRQIDKLPVTPTRWRLRIANLYALSGNGGTGTVTMTSAWIGAPALPTTTATPRWGGAFSAAPTNLVNTTQSVGNTAGTEYVSPWFDSSTYAITAQTPFALSFGFQNTGGTWFAENYGGCFFASQSANAGQTTAPSGLSAFRTLDVRFEYEYTSGEKVVVAVGDSITLGRDGGDTITPGGCFGYEGWPERASLAQGWAVVNLGASSQTASNFTTSTNWDWARADLATTVPDVAIISLGTNDIQNSTSATSIEGYLASAINNLRVFGVKEIWLGTIIPRGWTDAREATRTAVNTWIRQTPLDIDGVVDFDKAISRHGDTVVTTANTTSGTATITLAGQGNAVYPGALVSSTAGGLTNSLVTANAAGTLTLGTAPTTTATGADITIKNPDIVDPDFIPAPATNPHPLRGGYQRMAQAVTL